MEQQQAMNSGDAWEHFPHAADMGVRGFGATQAEAFAHAALALTAIICEPQIVRPDTAVAFRCEAPDAEMLLYDWLNALVYEMAVRRMLFSRFEVQIEEQVLKATAWGEATDRLRHSPAVEVKGATFTELKVLRDGRGRWVAQCVVDV